MTEQEAWSELAIKFPWVMEDGCSPIYFWEPGEDTPVAPQHAPSGHKDGWRWTTFAEDIPEAYLVVKTPDAIGTVVVYAKWPRQGWDANPQVRHLIVQLLSQLEKVKQ